MKAVSFFCTASFKCIKKVFSPVNFVGRFAELDKLIKEFNQYLAFDSWQVVRNGTEITFAKAGKIEFEENVYNFGEITAGDTVRHTFKFKNVGKVPLVIAAAEAQCGCTVPEWPHEPINPGETGEIKVLFNSAHKIDKQDKKISVIANTNPDITVISLQGFVKPSPNNTN